MNKKPSIGATSDGELLIDVRRLLVTRMLMQADPGGGKSWVIRRILEQTAGHVQQIILDTEDEFSTLREKFDYVICAPQGADAIATPQTAAILARRLRETRVSAIINMYELKPQDRRRFVRLFLEELIEAPKSMWHPCIVLIDEAQLYAPEKGEAESLGAVIDLNGRGRKRGLCGILATQRLSKLSKDAAAGLQNKLIGITSLDLDVERAANELSMTSKKVAMPILRNLEPGEFYCFGPALSRAIVKVKVGPVQTTHPEPGAGAVTKPPEPSAKIRALLAKLTDLPKEADQEARTLADFKAENAKLKRELTIAKKAEPRAPAIEIKRVEIPAIKKHELKWLKDAAHEMSKAAKQIAQIHQRNREVYDAWVSNLNLIGKGTDRLIASLNKISEPKNPPVGHPTALVPRTAHPRPPSGGIAQPRSSAPGVGNEADPMNISGPQQRILDAIAWFESVGITESGQTGAAFLAGYRPTSSSFTNPRAALRAIGMIEYRDDRLALTDLGRQHARAPAAPLTKEELHRHVLERLPGPERKIFRALLDVYPNDIADADLAERTAYSVISSSFTNPKARLRSFGLAVYPAPKRVRAADFLFPGAFG